MTAMKNTQSQTSPGSPKKSRKRAAVKPEDVSIGATNAQPARAEAGDAATGISELPSAGREIPTDTEKPPQTDSHSAATAPAKKLSALEAAVQVLAETGQAMSCAELIAAMATKGYWSSPKGKTPASTLYASLLRELQTKGENARLLKSERGKFRLKDVR